MGAVILDHGVKPEQWGFDQGLVDSKWDWFWNRVTVPLIFNEPQVAKIINPKFRVNTWNTGGGGGVDISVGRGRRGIFLTAAKSGFDFATLDTNLSGLPLAGASEVQSFFFFCANLGSDAQFGGGIANPNGTDYQLQINASRQPVIRQAATTTLTATGTVPATGEFSVGFTVADASSPQQAIFIDGELDSTATSDGFGAIGDISRIFGLTGNTARPDLELYCYYQFNNTRLTAEQFRQLHRDPFGPFRMLDEVEAVIVPAAAAGGDGLDMPWPAAPEPRREPPQAVGY